MKKNSSEKKEIVIYQTKSGAIELRGDFSRDTIWATQAQIAKLFDTERSVITKHVKNILKDKELEEKSVCANFAHTADDGKTYMVNFYNLDMILSIGYRVNSKNATKFRQWANKILKQFLTDGYLINRKQISKNHEAFLRDLEDIKKLSPHNATVDVSMTLDLVKAFALTWFSLDAYDKERLPKKGATKKQVIFTAEEFIQEYNKLKFDWEKEAGAGLFGIERSRGSLEGIIGNIYQSFDGVDVYKTLEEKAAHLLYFMVKNHPFVDGNKRIGAFAFVWFLRRAKIFNRSRLSPDVLTILTVLVASSNPKEKDRIIGLVLNLLNV